MPARFPTGSLVTALLLSACGGAEPSADASTAEAATPAPAAAEPLSAIELEQGIGPIRDLSLGPIDPDLASAGNEAFKLKCSACHKVEERYVAPMLGDVLSRRRPEYVMNMMLNADEMVLRHPEARALLAEFFTPMPVQVTEETEARAILEYLRSAQIPSN